MSKRKKCDEICFRTRDLLLILLLLVVLCGGKLNLSGLNLGSLAKLGDLGDFNPTELLQSLMGKAN